MISIPKYQENVIKMSFRINLTYVRMTTVKQAKETKK